MPVDAIQNDWHLIRMDYVSVRAGLPLQNRQAALPLMYSYPFYGEYILASLLAPALLGIHLTMCLLGCSHDFQASQIHQETHLACLINCN